MQNGSFQQNPYQTPQLAGSDRSPNRGVKIGSLGEPLVMAFRMFVVLGFIVYGTSLAVSCLLNTWISLSAATVSLLVVSAIVCPGIVVSRRLQMQQIAQAQLHPASRS
jgi:hypothetical protein